MGERRYGYLRGHLDKRDKVFKHHAREEHLPDAVDLRNERLMPPVWDQGSQGSCVGFGVAALAAYHLRTAEPAFLPSPAHIYAEARARRGWLQQDSGAYVRDGVKVLAQQGCLPSFSFAYDDRVWDREPSDALQAKALERRVTGYARVPQDSYSIRAALADGHPIVFGFTVYAGFESVDAFGDVPMPEGAPLGGHCVVAVGYEKDYLSDGSMRLLVRNSWGAAWGMAGYCWMPFDYILDPELCADFTIVGLANG